MPKALVNLNNFKGGINNALDDKDTPIESLSEATDVVCDTDGQVRQMGKETTHALVDLTVDDDADTDDPYEMFGKINPGYGLFAFNTDHSITNNDRTPTKALAVQDDNYIGIHDGKKNADNEIVFHQNEIKLSNPGIEIPDNVQPTFYYVDGSLRVGDSNFSNSNDYPKSYTYFKKRWFDGATNQTAGYSIPISYDPAVEDSAGDWQELVNFLYPPSVKSDGSNSHQLVSASNLASPIGSLGSGCLGLHVESSVTEDSGEWILDSGLKFGASFVYDSVLDDKVNESPITNFAHTFDSASVGSAVDNHSLKIRVAVHLGTDTGIDLSVDNPTLLFDPRLWGVNIYWTGDSNGDFDLPLYLASMEFGTDDTTKARCVAHNGIMETAMTYSSGIYYNTNLLEITSVPTLDYQTRTTIPFNSETTCARWQTAVVKDRRTYIGGVQRYKFSHTVLASDQNAEREPFLNSIKQCKISKFRAQNLDRIMVSPVEAFDVFPSSNWFDSGGNDGESIVVLKTYEDFLLVFKTSSLYIYNIAGDLPILEHEHKYMGVQKDYQVCETEYGIAWVNKNGCFIFMGENNPQNLITNKLDPIGDANVSSSKFSGWASFVGESGMIGYLPKLKQIIVFEDPVGTNSEDEFTPTGDIMLFDMQSQSWTYGYDRVSFAPKSNIVTNYDETCLYISNNTTSDQSVDITQIALPVGQDAVWQIEGLEGQLTMASTKIKIGSTYILGDASSGYTWEPGGGGYDSLIDYLEYIINSIHNPTNDFIASKSGSTLIITRPATSITSGDSFAGQDLTFINAPAVVNTIPVAPSSVSNIQMGVEFERRDGFYGMTYEQLRFLSCSGDGWFASSANTNFFKLSLPIMHTMYRSLYGTIGVGTDAYNEMQGLAAFNSGWDVEDTSTHRSYLKFSKTHNHGYSANTTWEDNGGTHLYLNDAEHLDDDPQAPSGIYNHEGWGYGGTASVGSAGSSIEGYFGTDFTTLRRRFPHSSTGVDGGADWVTEYVGNPAESPGTIHHDGMQFATITIPSVTYRKLKNVAQDRASFVVTLWGDYFDNFVVNYRYQISGNNGSINNVVGSSGKGLKLSNKIKHDWTSSSGNTYCVTELQFESHLGNDDTNDTIVNIFDLKTCSAQQNTITFTSSISSVSIDNSGKDGVSAVGTKWGVHVNRNGKLDSVSYGMGLSDHTGNLHNITTTITENTTDYPTAKQLFDGLVAKHEEISDAPGRWVTQNQIHVSSGGENDSLLIHASGTKMKIDRDIKGLGLVAGDKLFLLDAGVRVSGDYWYTSGETPDPFGEIAEISDHGFDLSGSAIATAGGVAQSEILFVEAIKESDGSSMEDSAYKVVVFNTNAFEVIGKHPALLPEQSLSIATYTASGISVREFNNSKEAGESATSKNLLVETKLIDFDNPSTIKKIYNVSLTYKLSSGQDIVVDVYNEHGAFIQRLRNEAGDTTFGPTSGEWVTLQLEFASNTPVQMKACKISIKPAYTGASLVGFKLNDITISFRDLGR